MNVMLAVTLTVLMSHPTDPYFTDRRGVDGPSGFLWRSHEYLILRMPDLDFRKELTAIVETELAHLPWGGGETVSSEILEFRDAENVLSAAGVEGDERLKILDTLNAARDALPPLDEDKIGLWAWEGPRQGALTEETAKADAGVPALDFWLLTRICA